MGIADRLFDGIRATMELRSDVDRLAEEVKTHSAAMLDHEKRLIRIETMIEMSRAGSPTNRPRLTED